MDQNDKPVTTPTPPAPTGPKRNTLMAVLAYVLFFIPMITGDSKKDEFVKFHTKQGFALFVADIILAVISIVLSPFYFWWPIHALLNLGLFVLFVIGVVNAVNGKKQELPVIGKIGDWLKI